MSSVSRKSKDKLIGQFQTVQTAIRTYFAKKALVVHGKVWKSEDAIALLQGQIDALNSNAAAYATWLRDVGAQRATYTSQVAPFMTGLREFVSAQCGGASDEFLAFGFTARKKPGKTAAAKAQAVAQGLATRKARNTMGSKQKLAIRGVVPSATIMPQPTAPAPSAPTPTITAASVSSPNGSSGSSH
jgi:hypothetical protein